MNAKPSQSTIEEVAISLGIEPAFVEKDWFTTKIIYLLSKVKYDSFKLVFTGGTALSKAHKLIERYSEDIDFKVLAPKNRKKRKSLSDFKNYIIDLLRQGGFNITPAQVRAQNENQYFTIEIEYETYFNKHSALRNHIQIEISVRDLKLDPVDLSVSSFINQVSNKASEVEKVACVSPTETAADKLSAITWRIPDRIRGQKYDDPSIVRHIHDLAILSDIIPNDGVFGSLVIKAMESDLERPKNNQAFKNQSINEKFDTVISILKDDKDYPKEYKRFVESMSFASAENTPKYKDALEKVKASIRKVIDIKST